MQKGLFEDWEKAKVEAQDAIDPHTSGARFSPCRLYRYHLWRWPRRPVVWIMLNPSTADETQDDPTIRRCRGYASQWGYDGVIITNIFAYRSTDPKALKPLEDPVGPENDRAILQAVSLAAGPVVCAWGAHGKLHGRGAAVRELLRKAGVRPKAFGYTKDGHPWHPLYLASDLPLQEMP